MGQLVFHLRRADTVLGGKPRYTRSEQAVLLLYVQHCSMLAVKSMLALSGRVPAGERGAANNTTGVRSSRMFCLSVIFSGDLNNNILDCG